MIIGIYKCALSRGYRRQWNGVIPTFNLSLYGLMKLMDAIQKRVLKRDMDMAVEMAETDDVAAGVAALD